MRTLLILALLITAVTAVTAVTASAANVIHYPARAEKLRIDGEVIVLYDVNDQGKTENIRVINTEPKYVFDRNVQKQIAEWKYPKDSPQRDIPLRVIFKAN